MLVYFNICECHFRNFSIDIFNLRTPPNNLENIFSSLRIFFWTVKQKSAKKNPSDFHSTGFSSCFFSSPGGGIVGQGGERIRAIIEELGCEVQVSREPLAGIAGHKRVAWRTGTHGFFSSKQTFFFFRIVKCEDVIFI